MKPRLLDLFCGAGGAAKGYQRAGFYVVGVDIIPQPDYCGDEFVQADALGVLERGLPYDYFTLAERFSAIHASPPCQGFTKMQRQRKNAAAHPDLIGPTRSLLERTGLPYVIENVEEAASVMRAPVLLCGTMFDPPMMIRWHRLFEANWPLQHPDWPCRHKFHAVPCFPGTINGSGKRPGSRVVNPFASGTTHEMSTAAKGIDWIPSNGRKRPTQAVNDALPPAYTEFIGHQLMQVCQASLAPR